MIYDTVIIGGGPAGLSCGQYCARAGLSAIIISGSDISQCYNISHLVNYPGVEEISGVDLILNMEEQANNFGCHLVYKDVVNIVKEGDLYEVDCEDTSYLGYTIVMATGAKHKKLGVKGEDLSGVSYCAACDGPLYAGKDVAVIGGGDSALQEALLLDSIGCNVSIYHRRDTYRAQQALVDEVNSRNSILQFMNRQVVSINGTGSVKSITVRGPKSSVSEVSYDAVFVFVGTEPNSKLVEGYCQLDNNGYIITNKYCQTNRSDIFAVGDVRDTPFRQVVTSVADGAIAAHCIPAVINHKQKLREFKNEI